MINEQQTAYNKAEVQKIKVNSFAGGLAIGTLLGVAIIIAVVSIALMFA